ncbi:MAG: endogenous inhibitor of DNA gyrase (YacG/DUF329 family) [Phenylobacterium sp.]|jgi:endogenous inhibitor of DNA gyrase (YacG/DUF329 family)
MSKPQTVVNCPTCQTDVVWASTSEFRPFCSKRCQLIDLGEWANESQVIKGKAGFVDASFLPDDIEDIEAMLQQEEEPFFK